MNDQYNPQKMVSQIWFLQLQSGKKKKIALLELVCAFMFKNKDFWKDQVMPLLVSELAHLIKRQDVFSHRCHVTISPILCFQQMPCLFILSLQTLA